MVIEIPPFPPIFTQWAWGHGFRLEKFITQTNSWKWVQSHFLHLVFPVTLSSLAIFLVYTIFFLPPLTLEFYGKLSKSTTSLFCSSLQSVDINKSQVLGRMTLLCALHPHLPYLKLLLSVLPSSYFNLLMCWVGYYWSPPTIEPTWLPSPSHEGQSEGNERQESMPEGKWVVKMKEKLCLIQVVNPRGCLTGS